MTSLHTRPVLAVLAAGLALLAPSCTAMNAASRLGGLIAEHKLNGRMLPVRSELGWDVYRQAEKMSSTIAEYAAVHGYADYIVIEQPHTLIVFTLVYAQRDTAAYFRGPKALSLTGSFSEVIEETPIPRALWGRMSNADQQAADASHSSRPERSLNGRWRDAY